MFVGLFFVYYLCENYYKPTTVQYLREAEDIKKRWQEYTKELYRKDLSDPDNHNGGYQITQWCDHSPRVRHPGLQSQVGPRKHHYELS